MPHEPKRRHSRQRKGKRRASIELLIPNAVVCPNCKAMTLPHAVCKNCGFYKSKEYINKNKDKKKDTQTTQATS